MKKLKIKKISPITMLKYYAELYQLHNPSNIILIIVFCIMMLFSPLIITKVIGDPKWFNVLPTSMLYSFLFLSIGHKIAYIFIVVCGVQLSLLFGYSNNLFIRKYYYDVALFNVRLSKLSVSNIDLLYNKVLKMAYDQTMTILRDPEESTGVDYIHGMTFGTIYSFNVIHTYVKQCILVVLNYANSRKNYTYKDVILGKMEEECNIELDCMDYDFKYNSLFFTGMTVRILSEAKYGIVVNHTGDDTIGYKVQYIYEKGYTYAKNSELGLCFHPVHVENGLGNYLYYKKIKDSYND